MGASRRRRSGRSLPARSRRLSSVTANDRAAVETDTAAARSGRHCLRRCRRQARGAGDPDDMFIPTINLFRMLVGR